MSLPWRWTVEQGERRKKEYFVGVRILLVNTFGRTLRMVACIKDIWESQNLFT